MSEDVHVVVRSTPPCLSVYLEDPGSNEDCLRTKLDPGKTQKIEIYKVLLSRSKTSMSFTSLLHREALSRRMVNLKGSLAQKDITTSIT